MRIATTGFPAGLKDHAGVVTSSAVLAAVASQQYARSELEGGSLSWHRPPIYSLDTWLAVCWQEMRYSSADLPSLLSPSQESLLWERIIADSARDLFDVAATARLAREAFRLAVEWQIPFSDDRWSLHEDAQQFAGWVAAFRTECQRNGWMTASDVLMSLQPARERVLFIGFEHPSPALKLLFQSAGTLLPFEAGPRAGHSAVACADMRAQLETAARWARWKLEANPRRSLGIFVPNLAEWRAQIERAFDNVFYPASALRRAEDQTIFHINRAQSLYQHPLLANALLFLELARPRIEISAATAIVRSPFIAGASEERAGRGLADLKLRRFREMDVSLRDIESATQGCAQLSGAWRRMRDVLQSKPRRADASVWSKFFGDLVQATGWPGDYELTAAQQQLVEGWKDSLSSLATLGLVARPMDLDAALYRLRQILGGAGHQRGDWYSPVQILDSVDAPGLVFDASFAVGLSEETWPPSVRISPLIPISLQRAHGVPNSTSTLMQSERIRLTEALFSTGPEVSGSYSEHLSPLAGRYVKVVPDSEVPKWGGKVPVESFAPVRLDEVEDSQAPPFDLAQTAVGGTGIIKTQSACAFRAFAEYRLGAQSPEDSCFGFDARDRGGFVHKAMQHVWEELKSFERLKSVPDSELRELVKDCVTRAVTARPDSEFHAQTTAVERERLESLLWEWLNEVEKQRKISFTVESTENELQYNLAGLPLRLRVDRMDRLKNGSLLLIDYKSGKVTKNKLDCPRPAEPQLLVYAAAKSPEVEGMLFGAVRAREARLVGKTRDRHMSGNSTAVLGDGWDDLVAKAEQEVRRLASEFIAGIALVDPSKGACSFCANPAFCRINESARGSDEEG